MKKWFYVFMLSLMVIFGMMGCAPTSGDIENNGEKSEPTPVHITIPKRRRNFTEDIDTISIVDESGEMLYECNTDNEVSIKLDDGVLIVAVPKIHDSCFDKNGELRE